MKTKNMKNLTDMTITALGKQASDLLGMGEEGQVATANQVLDTKSGFEKLSSDLHRTIITLEDKLRCLQHFDTHTYCLFKDGISNLEIAMEGVTALHKASINELTGEYILPKSAQETQWYKELENKENITFDDGSINMDWLDPIKESLGKNSDIVKYLSKVAKLYPGAFIDKLIANGAFWEALNVLPKGAKEKVLLGLEKYIHFGNGKVLGKLGSTINGLGKGTAYFTKWLTPVKAMVKTPLRWILNNGPYIDLGIHFIANTVDEYRKVENLGKAAIGGAIETVKGIDWLDGMGLGSTIGVAVVTIAGVVAAPKIAFAALVGGGIGFALGKINEILQSEFPSVYKDIKDGAYKLYDEVDTFVKDANMIKDLTFDVACRYAEKTVENIVKDIGRATVQSVDTVRKTFKGIKLPVVALMWKMGL